MKLKSIQFSGFKSFVDPTKLNLPSNIIGIVGPNGCGKSNVIDAIRWVMGESSAKTLRGDNMTDVIFNGSSSRKPVSKASVELSFDNSDGRAIGAYSQYSEIVIKRSLTRDGKSDYYLNNVRCRRKDVTDIFLGTGLGSRSYSIIEQGMISRVIEAKPEDLRHFVEEAAGISKYKTKRHETQNRIRHTRENLERVTDVLTELQAQLKRLDRQSKQAKRYKELKQREREIKGQSHALQWQAYNQKLNQLDLHISRKEKQMASSVATQRESQAKIEALRELISSSQDSLNTIQSQYYGVGADISAIEQQLEHKKQNRIRQQQELKQVSVQANQIRERLLIDSQRKTQCELEIAKSQPLLKKLEQAKQFHSTQLEEKETYQQDWQKRWDAFQQQSNQLIRQQEALKARIQHLTTTNTQLERRHHDTQLQLQTVDQELKLIDPADLLNKAQEQDHICSEIEAKLENIALKINNLRSSIKNTDVSLKSAQQQLLETGGKLHSLKELQKAALGQNDKEFSLWLLKSGLHKNRRLTNLLVVDKGWEKAVDTALNTQLACICVENINHYMQQVEPMSHIELNFIELPKANANPNPNPNPKTFASMVDQPSLLSKISCEIDLTGLLGNVFITQNLASASLLRSRLVGNQCLITPDGTMIGSNWISISKKQDVRSGTVKREKSISQLSHITENLKQQIADDESCRELIRLQLVQLETSRAENTNQLAQVNAKRTELYNQLGQQQARIKASNNKKIDLSKELISLVEQVKQSTQSLNQSEAALAEIQEKVDSSRDSGLNFTYEREQLREDLLICRKHSNLAQETWSKQWQQHEKLSALLESMREAVERGQQHIDFLVGREQQTKAALKIPGQDEAGEQKALQQLLEKRIETEEKLRDVRNQVSETDMQISAQDQCRQKHEQLALDLREKLEHERLGKQELLVKQNLIKSDLNTLGIDLDQLISSLPEGATLAVWQQHLNSLEQKISRLGMVNLLAIQEYDEQQERKMYLDSQHEDLVKALTTLESVMHKIDKETRQRFRETFDALNKGFQAFFPLLFGGGSASLELTEDDLLTAGVAVMARPPGKRNSTIHLLSGGEKALTAVSLMFSLFKLNPSPLCILDEVDAPLDDINVERYCRTLLQMAQHTQLLFITHSKITMEYAKILIGVTMQEPGVSRLVSVDVDEAVRLAS